MSAKKESQLRAPGGLPVFWFAALPKVNAAIGRVGRGFSGRASVTCAVFWTGR